jgi:hypothetical protein
METLDPTHNSMLSELSFIEIPRDEKDGDFVVSFELEDAVKAKLFFEEYGFVVSKPQLGNLFTFDKFSGIS